MIHTAAVKRSHLSSFAVKQLHEMKHGTHHTRGLSQSSQHDENISVLANDSVTPYRGNQSEKTCSWSGAKTDDSRRAKKKFPSSVSYMLRSVVCICYIFIHKISFSVNISKNSMAQFTPEEMVKAILEEPRARTLMEKQ